MGNSGWNALLTSSGLGALRPNVVVMQLPQLQEFPADDSSSIEEKRDVDETKLDNQFHLTIQTSMKMRFSTMVVRFPRNQGMDFDRDIAEEEMGNVDVWQISDTGGFTLLIPALLSRTKYWRLRMEGGKAQSKYYKRLFA